MMDFSNYPLSSRFYGGSEKKAGILVSGSEYMLKFQTRTAFGVRMNHVSEYLGSSVFNLLGLPAQETFLGTYQDEEVVACKNFIEQGEQFVPFNDVGESTLDQDKDRYQYEYTFVMQMLRDNQKLTRVQATISAFWEIFIIDALLGNFDRHGSNWGFIKKENKYSLAPVFDNGSCLFPQLTQEHDMLRIMNSEEETNKRIFTFPTSQIKLLGKKSSYYGVIHSLSFPECNEALVKIVRKIDINSINSLIDGTMFTGEIRKAFLKYIVLMRYEKILLDSYRLLTGVQP